jgi:hypothetical protein
MRRQGGDAAPDVADLDGTNGPDIVVAPDFALTDDRHNAVSVLLNRTHPNPSASCK